MTSLIGDLRTYACDLRATLWRPVQGTLDPDSKTRHSPAVPAEPFEGRCRSRCVGSLRSPEEGAVDRSEDERQEQRGRRGPRDDGRTYACDLRATLWRPVQGTLDPDSKTRHSPAVPAEPFEGRCRSR